MIHAHAFYSSQLNPACQSVSSGDQHAASTVEHTPKHSHTNPHIHTRAHTSSHSLTLLTMCILTRYPVTCVSRRRPSQAISGPRLSGRGNRTVTEVTCCLLLSEGMQALARGGGTHWTVCVCVCVCVCCAIIRVNSSPRVEHGGLVTAVLQVTVISE